MFLHFAFKKKRQLYCCDPLLLAHAWRVHHAHSHVRGHLTGGAHAIHTFCLGHIALAHAAEEAFLRIHGAVHVHAAVLHGPTVMTHTHAHHLFRHHLLLRLRHLAHHFIHVLHIVILHHFNSPKLLTHARHLTTGIWAKFAYWNRPKFQMIRQESQDSIRPIQIRINEDHA